MKLIQSLITLAGKVFKTKSEVDKAKIDKQKSANQNISEVQKNEIESDDVIVRRNRYYILILVVAVIVLEAFGIRLAILKFLGVDPSTINFDKILTLFSDVLASAFLGG